MFLICLYALVNWNSGSRLIMDWFGVKNFDALFIKDLHNSAK